MFERIKYSYSAGFSHVSVEVWIKDNEIHYSKIIAGKPEEYTQDSVSAVTVDDFSYRFGTGNGPGCSVESVDYIK